MRYTKICLTIVTIMFLHTLATCQFGFSSFSSILNVKSSTSLKFGISNPPIMVVKAPGNIIGSIGQGPIASYNVGSQATTISYEVHIHNWIDQSKLWDISRRCLNEHHIEIYGGLDLLGDGNWHNPINPKARAGIEFLANMSFRKYSDYPNTKVKFAVIKNTDFLPSSSGSYGAAYTAFGGQEVAQWQFRIK